MRSLAAVVGVVIVLAALKAASSVVVPVLLAATIAVGFHPVTELLIRRGVPTVAASLISMVCVLAAIAGIGALVVLAAQDLADNAPSYADQISKLRGDVLDWLDARGLDSLSSSMQEVDVGARASSLVSDAVVLVSDVLGDLLNVLIVTAFIQLETGLLSRKLELLLAPRSLERTRRAIDEVQKYLRVKFILAVLNGVLLGGWCWVMGVSNPVLWGVIAFAFNFVPVIGSLISAVPPVLLALLQSGLGSAAGVAAGYIAVNIAVDNVLEARLMGRTLGLSPLVLMVSLLVWGFVLGPVGALLSVPLTVAVRIYLDYHDETRWLGLLLAGGTRGYEDLRDSKGEAA